MEDAFGIVLFVVVGIAAVAAVWALVTSGGSYDQIGGGGLSVDEPRPAAGPVAAAEREAEIRQMFEARNARRAARGEPPLDLDAELRALSAPADPELRDEVR